MALKYAERRRADVRGPPLPRNMAAAARARELGVPLVVSFVGDTPWPSPTVYCDSGVRYDWNFVKGLRTIVVVQKNVAALDAMRAILEQTDTVKHGYPVLVDLQAQEVACIVDGAPIGLWQVKRGTALWQQYFKPQA